MLLLLESVPPADHSNNYLFIASTSVRLVGNKIFSNSPKEKKHRKLLNEKYSIFDYNSANTTAKAVDSSNLKESNITQENTKYLLSSEFISLDTHEIQPDTNLNFFSPCLTIYYSTKGT